MVRGGQRDGVEWVEPCGGRGSEGADGLRGIACYTARVPSHLESFLLHLERVAGKEAEFRQVSPPSKPNRAVAIIFTDWPEPGSLTAVSYGRSLVLHKDGPGAELALIIRSADPAWPLAVCELAERLQTAHLSVGDFVRWGDKERPCPISSESDMEAFLISEPSGPLEPFRDASRAEGLELFQVIPILAPELHAIAEHGAKLVIPDPADPNRSAVC